MEVKKERNSTIPIKVRIITGILITVGAFFALAVGNYIFPSNDGKIRNEILTYCIPFAYLIVVYGIARKFNLINQSFFENKDIRFKGLKTFFTGFLCMILAICISILSSVLPFVGTKSVENFNLMLIQLIVLSLCIGIFEEGLFRGVILRILFKDNSKKSLWIGFMFSSFLFGMIHFGNLTIATQRPIAITSQVIYAMMLGLLLSALYIRFKSYIGIVCLHGFVDFISFVPRLYGKDLGTSSEAVADISLKNGLTTVGVLVPSAILGIVILIRFSKKYYCNK